MLGRDLNEAEQWVADWSAAVSERAEQAQRLAARVAGTTATADGAGGLIEVRVDSSGALTALHLDDRVTGWPAARIERMIMSTLRQAQTALFNQISAAVADTVGADTETGRAVLDGYERRFPVATENDNSDGGRRGR